MVFMVSGCRSICHRLMVRDGVLLLVLERSSDKALEQGMCAVGAALEFGVELYAHMEITAGQLNSFHQAPCGRRSE